MAHIIERVCAKDLALTTLALQSFEDSVERLYLSFLKTNAAILDLGEEGWDDQIQTCLANVSADVLPDGSARRGIRGKPAIARIVNEYRLGQKGSQDWCGQEDLQHVGLASACSQIRPLCASIAVSNSSLLVTSCFFLHCQSHATAPRSTTTCLAFVHQDTVYMTKQSLTRLALCFRLPEGY